MKKVLYTIITILWMAVIFSFSAEPADESMQMSHSVGRIVGRIFISDFNEWSQSQQEAFAERIDYPVRKCAHASEYAILGMLLWITISGYMPGKSAAGAFLTGIVYAAGDELHQLFVPGRSCQMTDVLIDGLGILAGLLILYVMKKIKKIAYMQKNRDLR